MKVWGVGYGVSGIGLWVVMVLGVGVAGASSNGMTQAMSGSASPAVANRGMGSGGPVVEVDFTNPGLTPSHWVLTLTPEGEGHFWSENGQAGSAKVEQADAPGQPQVPLVDRDIRVSKEFARHVFDAARGHKLFAEECDGHMKVAFQGWKKLTYRGPEGQGSCGFNYSKDKGIQELGESLVAVGETILEGSKLDWLLRYDRLGLDREMEYVVNGAGDGRLMEFGTIKGVLERLAEDEGVLDRVRKRARTLLARIQE